MAGDLDTAAYLNQWTTVPAAYNRRDLLTYAVGIGCESMPYVYERNRNFAAFPTYPFVLSFKGEEQDVESFPSKAMKAGEKAPPLKGVKVLLDGERRLEQVKPLPKAGAKLLLRRRLTGVFKKPKGAVLESEVHVVDAATEEVYCKLYNSGFLVGAHGFTPSGGASNFPRLDDIKRTPDATATHAVSTSQALIYRLSGDYNPLHVDPGFAAASGFKAPILHGLCSLGISTRLVLDRYAAGDAKRFKTISARFTKPVLPGQTLEVQMWRESATRIRFQTVVRETKATCVANAYVELQGGGADAKL